MKKNTDYLFLFTLKNKEQGIAFCKPVDITSEEAREKVIYTFEEKLQKEIQSLNYLGLLDYSEMDKGIVDYLDKFEKHSPVWLWYAKE